MEKLTKFQIDETRFQVIKETVSIFFLIFIIFASFFS